MTEGELWARAELATLRAQRYRPRAWTAFVSASFRYAVERRRQRRDAERQLAVVAVAGVAVVAATARLGGVAGGIGAAAWWLAVIVMVELHLGMAERPNGTRLDGLGGPNLVSLVRAALVPLIVVSAPRGVAAVVAISGLTDVLDGQLARKRALVSRLGQWLDPTVDAVVVATAAVALAHHGLLPMWVAAVVVARSALPWLAIAAAYFALAEAPPRDRFVPGRLPGVAVFAGLVAAAATGSPAATALVVVGAAAGFATFAASAVRTVTRL